MTPRIPPWESLTLSLWASEEIHSVPFGHSCPRREFWRGKDVDGATFSSLWYCWVVWWGGGECPAEDGVEACSAQLYKTNHPGDFCF